MVSGNSKLSLPVDNLILDLLDEELVDGGGREDQLRLQNSGTQRQLGDIRSVLRINSLEVENCQLVIVDNSLVSHIGPALIVVQDTQSLSSHFTLEGGDH